MRQIVNTNVCVIGGAGFIGSHLVDYLIDERNCNVIVLDLDELQFNGFLEAVNVNVTVPNV